MATRRLFFEGGVIYAPRGTIEIAGNSLTTAGWFLAREVNITKNNLTLNNNVIAPSEGIDLGLSEPVYEVRVTTSGTGATLVRLVQEQGAIRPIVWEVGHMALPTPTLE